MDKQERRRIERLIQILELFKESNSTIPLQQVITFLQVARTPGIGVTDVARASQTHIASASRHVGALRRQRAEKSPLIAAAYGKDQRTRPLILTEEGHRLVANVLAMPCEVTTAVAQSGNRKSAPVRGNHRDGLRSVETHQVAWDPFGAT